jgi:hypothetical protein
MRALWLFHRRAVLTIGVMIVVLAASIAVTVIDATGRRSGAISVPSTPPRRVAPATTVPAAQPYPVSTIDPPATTAQTSIDHRLAAAESRSAIAEIEALTVPAAADSRAYPKIPVAARRDPTEYATAFTTELLDRDYGTASRLELLKWAQGEEAANTLPGVPASTANKALYASLADPSLAGGTGTGPVPPKSLWAADARSRSTQRVTGITVTVDPSWTRIVSEGWQPRDPLMTMMDVKATLVVTDDAHLHRHIVSMVVALGSCAHQPGLRAVAVQDWSVR